MQSDLADHQAVKDRVTSTSREIPANHSWSSIDSCSPGFDEACTIISFYSESIPDQVLGNGFLDMDGTRREHPGLEQLNIAILIPGHHPIHCWWGLKQLGLPLTKYLEFNI